MPVPRRTRRPSASWAGRRATRPGARDSRLSTRRSPWPTDGSLTRPRGQAIHPASTAANGLMTGVRVGSDHTGTLILPFRAGDHDRRADGALLLALGPVPTV